MRNYETVKGAVIKSLLKKFPNAFSKTIARMAYTENPALFMSIEDARSVVRYHRGNNGKYAREKSLSKEFYREISEDNYNAFGFPDSECDEFPPFVIDPKYKKVLIISDLHIPYHDIKASNIAIKAGIDAGCKAILLNGDIIDVYSLSRFERDPTRRNIAGEFDDLERTLKIMEKHFTVFYKLGNHEERYQSYLRVKAPELLGIPEFQFNNIFKNRGCETTFIYKSRVLIGKLTVIHGHEYGFSISGVNPARALFMKANKTSACGHVHRTSEHVDKSIDEKIIGCWSFGCLCGLSPEYAVNNKWNHGFGIVEFNEAGDFTVKSHKIINYNIH